MPPTAPVSDADRQLGRRERPLRREVAGRQQERAHRAPAAISADAGRAGQPAGQLRCGQRDEGDRPGGRGRHRGRAATADAAAGRAGCAPPVRPAPAAASSPISSMRRSRPSSSAAAAAPPGRPRGADLLPAAAVEAAGQPHLRGRGVVAVGAGDQVGLTESSMALTPMPDQDQPEALHAALEREQVDRQRGQPARRPSRRARCPRTLSRRGRESTTTARRWRRRCVKPMMSGLPSGLRVRLWKIAPLTPSAAPTSSAGQHPGQPQVVDDEVGRPGRRRPNRRARTSAERDRVKSPVDSASTDAEGEQQPASATTPLHGGSSGPSTSGAAEGPGTGRRAEARPGRRRESGHSAAIRRRRTSAMNTGAPTNAVTMPTSSSPGPHHDPAEMSEPSSRIGARTSE